MILIFLRAYWKQLAELSVVLVILFSIGHSIYSWGASNNEKNWVARIAERDRIAAQQVIATEKLSKTVSDTATTLTAQSDSNLTKIILSVKNKPLYTVSADGKCNPSVDFEKAYNDIIKTK